MAFFFLFQEHSADKNEVFQNRLHWHPILTCVPNFRQVGMQILYMLLIFGNFVVKNLNSLATRLCTCIELCWFGQSDESNVVGDKAPALRPSAVGLVDSDLFDLNLKDVAGGTLSRRLCI